MFSLLKLSGFLTCLFSLLIPGIVESAEQNLSPESLYTIHCAACHQATDNARAPSIEQLRGLSPAAILVSLTSGKMAVQGSQLTEYEKQNVAEYMTGLSLAETDSVVASTFCSEIEPLSEPLASPSWNGWGANLANTRYQETSGSLKAGDVSQLELAWSFGFPNALAARTQPTIIGDWLFTGGEDGTVYALDADSGCTIWQYQADAAVRTAMTVTTVADIEEATTYVLVFGDGQANAYGLNAETGVLLWQRKLDIHPNAGITGAPAVFDGKVYVPVSAAGEEVRGPNPDYGCCTFRGSVSALDLLNGEVQWKTYAIPESPSPRGRSEQGVQLFGPAGAGIWGAPTIDQDRGVLYVGTGNGYADPPQPTTDAILAIQLTDGAIRWIRQTLPNDNWLWQCEAQSNLNNPNCPTEQGPDFDFSAAPLIATLSSGKQLLVVPQKSGMVYALDPDNAGNILWEFRIGEGSSLGGQWGAAADRSKVYIGVADTLSEQQGGLYAIDLESGQPTWYSPPRPTLCDRENESLCFSSQGGPVTVTPGIVFSGGSDGGLRAYDTNNGDLLWEYNTNREFQTVNGIQAKGATIDAAGPVISGNMLFVTSGYNGIVGRAGNVLLAFKVGNR